MNGLSAEQKRRHDESFEVEENSIWWKGISNSKAKNERAVMLILVDLSCSFVDKNRRIVKIGY